VKQMTSTWGDRILAAFVILATVFVLWLGAGCRNLPAFEVCYVHPKYGTVCVEINGDRHFKATLTPAEKEEVERWIASGGK